MGIWKYLKAFRQQSIPDVEETTLTNVLQLQQQHYLLNQSLTNLRAERVLSKTMILDNMKKCITKIPIDLKSRFLTDPYKPHPLFDFKGDISGIAKSCFRNSWVTQYSKVIIFI